MTGLLTIGFLLGFTLCGFLMGLFYLDARLRQLERERHLPYRLRRGLDDMSAVETDVLLWIRDALTVIEGRQEDGQRLMGQIRNGSYHDEQPAAPRRTGSPPKRTSDSH